MVSPSYKIVEYDADWPAQFQEERALVVSALGTNEGCVEHIGSTSVPGLAAKPIIDMMVGIPSMGEAEETFALLGGIGYQRRGETVPGTLHISKATPRRYHLHITEHGGTFWVDLLLFRDYLGSHADASQQYEKLKREVRSRISANPRPRAYNDGKADFIRATVTEARRELESGA